MKFKITPNPSDCQECKQRTKKNGKIGALFSQKESLFTNKKIRILVRTFSK